MSRLIADLDPAIKSKAQAFVLELQAKGIKYTILETLRTVETQRAYYAQGRASISEINKLRSDAGLWPIGEAESKRIITYTMDSKHLKGQALDVAPLLESGRILWTADTPEDAARWRQIGEIGEKHGLSWGGRWHTTKRPLNAHGLGWDLPHFEI